MGCSPFIKCHLYSDIKIFCICPQTVRGGPCASNNKVLAVSQHELNDVCI